MRPVTYFVRIFVWFSIRNMIRHRGRAVAVLVGIALGAAVFTSVRLSVHASITSFVRSMDLIAGQADLVAVRPGGRVEEQLIGPLLKHPAVKSASPVLTAYVRQKEKPDETFLLLGFDPILDRDFRQWQAGRTDDSVRDAWLGLLQKSYTVIIGETLARHHGLAAGDTVTLEHARQTVSFKILTTLAPRGLALVEGGRVAITDIATFQEFTGLQGYVDRIDVLLMPDVGVDDVRQIESLLPHGVILEPPAETKKGGARMIRAYQLNLSILSFVSLFVGMFLIYSLIALNAAARRHELAVLRSVGASARLVFLLFMTEGFSLGLVGWIAAIPLSSALVKYLLGGISETISTLFVRIRVDRLVLSGWELLLSFAITILVALLASYKPARDAMRVAPREAMSVATFGSGHATMARIAVVGCILVMLVVPLSRLPGLSDIPLPGYIATFLLFAGFSLMSPWVLRKLGDFSAPLLQRTAGEPGHLAARYVGDSGLRTAISVGALITAVALFVALVIMIHSFRHTVELWVHQTISGDLFVGSKMAEINRHRDPLPQNVVHVLQNLGDSVDIVPYRRFYLDDGHVPHQFETIAFDTFFRHAKFFWIKGVPADVIPKLIGGEGVVVSEVFTNRTGLSVGDRYRALIESSIVDLPILGVVRDYRTQGGVVFYSMRHFNERYHDSRWSWVRIYFRSRSQDLQDATEKLRADIVRCCGDTVDLISGEELRHVILRIFDETFGITLVLLVIALFVAALGIATTLVVLVLERTRELNTLYAVGADFGQIRSMIFWEAFLMVIAGECLGLLCGFFLSYLLVFVINYQSFGWTFIYRIDWAALFVSLPLIIGTALVASLPAARMVFRQSPATILREQ